MSRRYKFHDKDAVYFVTFSVVDWVDVFTRNDYRRIVADSMKYWVENKELSIHAWVIMSNHVHMLISLKHQSNNTLSGIMRDMKKFTAMHLIKAISENSRESRREWLLSKFGKAGTKNTNNVNYQFWQQNNHPIQIADEKQYRQVLAYICKPGEGRLGKK